MAIEIYLGNPPAHIADWIRNHSQSATHEETWYKYQGDTEWRTVMIGDTIQLMDYGESTGQIENETNIVAIEIGTGTQANPLTNIGDTAFSGCNLLTSITIPTTIINYGDMIFNNCASLNSVTLPNNITEIYFNMFADCSNLTNITIPSSVTNIVQGAFSSSGLMSITIPNSVTSIESGAFANCHNLMNLTIPNNVTNIDSSAFEGCSGLTSVTIGNSVTSIGYRAFSNCSSLTSMTFLGKTLSQVQEMENYPWGISNTNIISVA